MLTSPNTALATSIQTAMLKDMRSPDGSITSLAALFAKGTPQETEYKWAFSLLRDNKGGESALQESLLGGGIKTRSLPAAEDPKDGDSQDSGCTLS